MSSSGDLKRNLYHHTREWKATDDLVRRAEILEMAVTELMMFTRKGGGEQKPGRGDGLAEDSRPAIPRMGLCPSPHLP